MTQDAPGILEPFRKYLKVLAELQLDRKLRGKLGIVPKQREMGHYQVDTR